MPKRNDPVEVNGVVMRRCSRCKNNKPLTPDYFYRAGGKRIPFQGKCKECDRARLKAHKNTFTALDGTTTRRCKSCKKHLPLTLENFPKVNHEPHSQRCADCNEKVRATTCVRCGEMSHRKGPRRKYCPACAVTVEQERSTKQNTNPEMKGVLRARRQRRIYGLSPAILAAMKVSHGGICAICKKAPATKGLVIDHCHATGVVRGMLCTACNVRLGVHETDWGRKADLYLASVEVRREEWERKAAEDFSVINWPALLHAGRRFHIAKPFSHVVIDDFFSPHWASALAAEFPSRDSGKWHLYDNAIEVKRTCCDWNSFGKQTYRALSFLVSEEFSDALQDAIGFREKLVADMGLHGGGLHACSAGGRLNPHQDYMVHPKLQRPRCLNVIVYLTPGWSDDWGGHFGLWEKNPVQLGPGSLVKSIAPKFNRAVIFDTRNAWHGLAGTVDCPDGVERRSLAVYYLSEKQSDETGRTKALFAPTPEQASDVEVLDLIKRRSKGQYK